MKNNKPYAYRITFFGNTIDLKDLLGDDELDALDWLENFTTNYDMNTIKTGLKTGLNFTVDSVTYNDALVVPLITHTERLYYDSVNEVAGDGNLFAHTGTGGQHHHGVYWEQLKYAIRVHLIVKAIEEKYSISFSTDFFNSSNAPYYNLYMWMHRKKGFIDDPNAPEQYTQLVQFGLDNTMTNVEAIAERIIVSNQTGANKITSTLTVRPNSSENTSYTVTVLKDGQVYDTIVATAPADASKDIDLVDGTYTVRLAVTEQFTFGDSGVENAVDWEMSDLQVPESHTFDVTEFTINATKEFSGTAQMPKQKVIDFLTGLFKTYNLTAFKEDDGTIKVQTLDSFYTAGTSYDISEFVDINSSQINVALPYREIEFKYKGLGTKLALQHEQLAGQGWGTTNFRGGDDEVGEIAGDIYTVESPFEHMKYERLLDAGANFAETDAQVGWCVDDNDDPYIGEPVLFYPIQITNGTEIRFLEGLTSGEEDIDDYWIPSNSVSTSSSTSTANINFKQELNEYSPDESFTGTLFQNYYTTYITDVFKTKRRLSKFKAFLPLKILRNYTLADRFVVNNRSYKINSITTNLGTGESDIELLNEV